MTIANHSEICRKPMTDLTGIMVLFSFFHMEISALNMSPSGVLIMVVSLEREKSPFCNEACAIITRDQCVTKGSCGTRVIVKRLTLA